MSNLIKPVSSDVVLRGRRQFLRGLGGALVAMPFLPSLMPREAKSQTPPQAKFFAAFTTGHGGVWFDHMFPREALLTESATYAGRSVRRGALTPSVSGSTASLSPVLSAPSSALTAGIAAKMNVISGLDIPWYIAHHSGGHLGNFAANDSHEGEPTATIDQVMAYSPDFYPNLNGILVRSLHFGTHNTNYNTSFNWANPTARTGEIQAIQANADTLKAFDKVFVAPSTGGSQTQRTPVVDRVYESYRRLAQGDRRISKADKQRLEEHMARLSEIQRRSAVVVDCSGTQRPTRNASSYWVDPGPQGQVNSVEAYKLFNDVLVAAFLCGTCRIGVVGAHHQDYALFADYVGDWHQLAHAASQGGNEAAVEPAEAEGLLQAANQSFFQNAYLDLVTKLDAADNGTGGTLLDDSLVVWTQESCHLTHYTFSVPVVTAGSAGGALRTGSYIDYRNKSVDEKREVEQHYNPGLLWNQWLGVELQAMGISRASYETAQYQPSRPQGTGTGGYGLIKFDADSSKYYSEASKVLAEIPPYLRPA